MTYCIGLQVDSGLVFLSDSRTNAGVDHINTFRKMTVLERPGDRVMVLLTSGNLAISQAVINELKPLINEIGDATLVVPLIKEYLDISVKNDDLLVKLAALAQRAINTSTSEGNLTITEEEKTQLLNTVNELKGK